MGGVVSQLVAVPLGNGPTTARAFTQLRLVTTPWLVVLAALFNLLILVAATSCVVAAVLFAMASPS
jgi:hypothetical protein